MLLGSGVLSAALAIGVRRQRGRFDTLVAVQRTLEGEVPLDRWPSHDCAPVWPHGSTPMWGSRFTTASMRWWRAGLDLAPSSAVALVLTSGAPLFVADTGERGSAAAMLRHAARGGRADRRRAGDRASR